MQDRTRPNRWLSATLLATSLAGATWAQHGVIREYAALAPKPDAVALRPLLDVPLTDVSIAKGHDGAYYMTGSAVRAGAAAYANEVALWRSADLAKWSRLRTLQLDGKAARSPEIHYLRGRYWLTLGIEGGGTDLLSFTSTQLASATFRRTNITARGEDPSLFLDDDGVFYWVMGAGEVAAMKADPMDGLAGEPKRVIAPLEGNLRSHAMRGAFLTKLHGYYHLFVGERRLRHGDLGRLGLAGGTDDVFVAVSARPDAGYKLQRYLAFPHAGQTTLFRGPAGRLWATFSCTDTSGVFRLKPGAFPVEEVEATQPRWPIGFDFEKPDRTVKYTPPGVMLRPDTAFLYEAGIGGLKPIPMDPVPGQRATFPWIRDTSILRGADGVFYMTGTSGNMDAIHLWRSEDLRRFRYVKPVFELDGKRPEMWYNQAPGRLLWAPELHYLNGTYWIPWCLSLKLGMGLLKSTSGRAEGPYQPTYQGNRAFLSPEIDASLFQDDDGSAYFIWQGRNLRKLNKDLSGFDGEKVTLLTVDGEQVGYEGIFLRKIGKWYVVLAAEWDGGMNREDGTYDMMYALSKKLEGPYSRRRVAVPHGGHSTLFQDGRGVWHLAFFGNDRTAPFRAMPGVVALDTSELESGAVADPVIRMRPIR